MESLNTCVIIAGGDVTGKIDIPEGAFVICADCGYRHAKAQGIVPDVLMGDFDSFTEPLPEGIEILTHPVEKDETDTMLAVWCGAERGCTEFHIYGVFGGARIDHSLANLQMLRHIALRGWDGILHHGGTTLRVQRPGTVRYPQFRGDFSLFALTEECTELTIRGTKYEAENITLTNTFPLCVSNTITEEFAEISLKTGLLLVVQVPEQSRIR